MLWWCFWKYFFLNNFCKQEKKAYSQPADQQRVARGYIAVSLYAPSRNEKKINKSFWYLLPAGTDWHSFSTFETNLFFRSWCNVTPVTVPRQTSSSISFFIFELLLLFAALFHTSYRTWNAQCCSLQQHPCVSRDHWAGDITSICRSICLELLPQTGGVSALLHLRWPI